MDENLHNIEDLFHDALDDNEEIARKNVWEAVEKRLDKDNIVSIKRKYTNVKRIAVLLLLLLVSYVLFDVYKTNTSHNGNYSIKKSGANPDNNDEKNNNAAAASNKKNGKNTETTAGNNLTKYSNNEDNITGTSDNNNLPVKSTQVTVPSKQDKELKQNGVKVLISQKEISENQAVITGNRKRKFNTNSASRVKIKNAVPTEDEQLLAEGIDKRLDNKIPPLKKPVNTSIENIQWLPLISVNTEKLARLTGSSKIKIADTSNNKVAKAEKKKVGKPSRFSLTPFFSPDIAWYRLQNDKLGNQPDNASELEKEERHEFSSTYGVLVDYKLSKHWGLQSGITLSNTNITVDPKTIYAQQDNSGSVKYRINTSSGYGYVLPAFIANPAIGDSLYAFTSTHSLQYVGIPVAVTYSITKGKFTLKTFAGVSTNILTKAKLEATVEKGFNNSVETVNNIEGLKKVYFSGLAGLGADYKLSKKTSLIFAPTMRFALNSITKDAPVKSYPVSLGFAAGLKIGL